MADEEPSLGLKPQWLRNPPSHPPASSTQHTDESRPKRVAAPRYGSLADREFSPRSGKSLDSFRRPADRSSGWQSGGGFTPTYDRRPNRAGFTGSWDLPEDREDADFRPLPAAGVRQLNGSTVRGSRDGSFGTFGSGGDHTGQDRPARAASFSPRAMADTGRLGEVLPRVSFDREYPSLGARGAAAPGSAPSTPHTSWQASAANPLTHPPASISDHHWTSKLAEVPANLQSQSPLLFNGSSGAAALAAAAAASQQQPRMADALQQVAAAAPQQHVVGERSRLELRQSKQLIPMVPGASKPKLGANGKPSGGAPAAVKASAEASWIRPGPTPGAARKPDDLTAGPTSLSMPPKRTLVSHKSAPTPTVNGTVAGHAHPALPQQQPGAVQQPRDRNRISFFQSLRSKKPGGAAHHDWTSDGGAKQRDASPTSPLRAPASPVTAPATPTGMPPLAADPAASPAVSEPAQRMRDCAQGPAPAAGGPAGGPGSANGVSHAASAAVDSVPAAAAAAEVAATEAAAVAAAEAAAAAAHAEGNGIGGGMPNGRDHAGGVAVVEPRRDSFDRNDPRLKVSAEEEAFMRSLGWTDCGDEDEDAGLTEEEIAAFKANTQGLAKAGSLGVGGGFARLQRLGGAATSPAQALSHEPDPRHVVGSYGSELSSTDSDSD